MLNKLLALVFGGLAVGWIVLQWRDFRLKIEWHQDADLPVAELVELPSIPDLPEANYRFSSLYADEVFPPDHLKAMEFQQKCLAVSPLSATLWYQIAREQMLLGKMEEARVSLTRSDELDPRYPNQRFGAIQLWSLLGDSQRALEVAREINVLGGRFRIAAAENLATIGLSPAEIFKELQFQDLDEGEIVDLMRLLRVDDPDQMEEAFKLIDLGRFQKTETRSALAAIASHPLNYGVISALWKAENPSLNWEAGQVVAENLDLRRPPFEKIFFMGWQPAPKDSNLDVRWVSPPETTELLPGQLELVVQPNREISVLHWDFYRFLVPDGVSGSLSLRYKVPMDSRLRSCKFQVKFNHTVIPSETKQESDDWQVVRAEWTRLDPPAVVELAFQYNGNQNPAKAEEEPILVVIGSFQISADAKSS